MAKVLDGVTLAVDSSPVPQKKLSRLIDAASKKSLLQDHSADLSFEAHVSLTSLPGAGAWLTAPPAPDGRTMDAPLFQVALKRRLRAPVYDSLAFCPACGESLDVFGDHA